MKLTEEKAWQLMQEDTIGSGSFQRCKTYEICAVSPKSDEAWLITSGGLIIGDMSNFLKILKEVWPNGKENQMARKKKKKGKKKKR